MYLWLGRRRISVTPCARHIRIPPSPHIPTFWQPCVCHPPHAIHASQHSYLRVIVICLHVSTHPGMRHSTCHGTATPVLMLDTSIPAAHPSSIILTHIMHSRDPTCSTLWDVHHVCTHVCHNWVLPTVRQILRDEIHCVVMSHSASYCCLLRSNCKFHFNSTCPDMLAYLLSPISQNHHSISAHRNPFLCSI